MPNKNPGDIEVRTLTVDGKDLKRYLVSFSVNESILTNTVVINITINQQEGLNLDLDSNGTAKLAFSTPDGKVKTYDNLKLDKIPAQVNSDSQKNKMMQLRLIPEDTLKNRANPGIQRSVVNKSVDKIVSSFLTNELGTKYKTNIEESKHLRGKPRKQPFVLGSKPIFGHVEDMRKEAVSTKDADEWLFNLHTDENGKLAYNFKPLSKYLENDSGITITNKPNGGINSFLGSMWNNAIRVNYLQDRDNFSRAAVSSVQTTTVDHKTFGGTKNNIPTGKAREDKTNSSVGLGGNSRATLDTKFPSTIPQHVDSNEATPKKPLQSPNEAMTLADLTQGGVQVMIPLNTDISPGMVLDLDLSESNESKRAKHTTQSGKNIVIGTYIYCGPITDNPRSTMVLTCSNITPNKKAIS